MQIPGLLIEYLINGSLALIWLLPLLMSTGYVPDKIDISSTTAVLLVPALYVLGMVIDSVANFIVRPHKRRIKESTYKKVGISEEELRKFEQHSIEAKFIIFAPELAKAAQIRSSRDRISRSAIVNVILSTTVLSLHYFRQNNSWLVLVSIIAAGMILILLCWGMWARFQYLSYDFEIKAYKALEEKRQHDRIRKGKKNPVTKAN